MKSYSFTLLLPLFLLLSACKNNGKKQPEANSTKNTSPLFALTNSEETGITFNNHIEENSKNFFGIFNYVYNGGGVAIADINNDGLSDIYFTGNEVPDKLYLNKGDFKFEDITQNSGINSSKGWNNGVVMADVNGDGFTDIYICRGGFKNATSERTNLLYINQKDNTFKEEAAAYGLADDGYSVMASFFDADNDNDLDLYLTNRPENFFLNYQQVLEGKQKESDLYRDKLYINTNGTFRELGLQKGIKQNFGYGLGLVTGDVDKDGLTDVFVGNDYLERDYLYMNRGNSQFKEELKNRFNHIPFYSMGTDLVDLNNDGWEDLIQLEMLPADYERSKTTMADMNTQLFSDMTNNGFHYQYMHNTLQLNRGNGIFSDVSQYAGIAKTDWSWACLANDYDHDGLRDILITNGFKRDIWDKDATIKFRQYMQSPVAKTRTEEENIKHIIGLYQENKISNYVYKNTGDLKFEDKTKAWGLSKESFSNGAATADLDNDGDLDLVINNVNDIAFVYENTLSTDKNYLKIKLEGPAGNKDGLGAKISIWQEGNLLYQEFKTVRGYLSSVEPIAHFGLGNQQTIDSITVVWPNGKENSLVHINTNQTLKISYGEAQEVINIKDARPTLFREQSATVFVETPTHQENIFDDFEKQVLLPHKLSQLGPCIAVGDVNNDGLDDFYLGGASGRPGEILVQTAKSQFKKMKVSLFKKDGAYEDVAASFFDADQDGDLDLYVVSGGNEFESGSKHLLDRLYVNNGKGSFDESKIVKDSGESGGCVIPFDFDNDGDLDVFVGGRVLPNAYPFAPKSKILQNNNGQFRAITAELAPDLENIGMVTDAIFVDVDGDQQEELILVGEWMPITVFKSNGNQWKNVTEEFGLHRTHGWYNTITAVDLNADGQKELIAGNLGLNYKFKANLEHPFKIYASDFDRNGTNDIFLAKEYKGREVPVRGLQCSSEQLPGLDRKFTSFSQFAKSNLRQIIGDGLDTALHLQAVEFATVMVQFNADESTITPLPYQAQFSSVNGIISGDYNADGHIDVILAGNKFEAEIETTRADASVGLVLLGDGKGNLKPMHNLQSGFFTPKNVKSLAQLQLANGRLAVLVGNNDDALQLFTLQKTL
ncbi:VCBS repeat-containing protein [Croceivirga sp. JEA036]|uniref:VCBS repeat-containing protein n=1 Tax=Croceivirga sp. JEA036 TaxID=2721162 RepID=UPI001439E52F|nr:VCBS repeat-containing protein [Croceivirga sp. JEA036]NJB35213.1 VCBS repeat-containing protein [Croceivirga sp. JEA036]